MKRLNVLIAGGGRVCESLLRYGGLLDVAETVIVIEKSEERSRLLQELFPQVMVLHGEASDADVYARINMDEVTAVLALTDDDDANLFVLAMAKMYNVPLRLGRFMNPKIAELVNRLQLGIPLIQPVLVASVLGQMLSSIFNANPLGKVHEELRLYTVTLGEADPAVGSRIGELGFEEYQAKPVLLFDGIRFKVPEPDDVLTPGVLLFVVASSDDFAKILKG